MSRSTVNILMATYNGARFLREQLASIARQSHTDWRLMVSDDGSNDETMDILTRFAKDIAQPVTLLKGPGLGPTSNFFHLISHSQPGSVSDLFAFADQDDVWLEDKLCRAVEWHKTHQKHSVRLYCGRTRYVDECLRPIGESRRLRRTPDFGNALVQNIASGNTMVFSTAMLHALQKIYPEHSVWHDWTTYLVASALEGDIFFDDEPGLLYRQHASNVIGSNEGFMAQLQRFKPIFQGRYKRWLDINVAAMHCIRDQLPASSKSSLEIFERMRGSDSCTSRIRHFLDSRIRRQSLASNGTLLLAVIFKLA